MAMDVISPLSFIVWVGSKSPVEEMKVQHPLQTWTDAMMISAEYFSLFCFIILFLKNVSVSDKILLTFCVFECLLLCISTNMGVLDALVGLCVYVWNVSASLLCLSGGCKGSSWGSFETWSRLIIVNYLNWLEKRCRPHGDVKSGHYNRAADLKGSPFVWFCSHLLMFYFQLLME